MSGVFSPVVGEGYGGVVLAPSHSTIYPLTIIKYHNAVVMGAVTCVGTRTTFVVITALHSAPDSTLRRYTGSLWRSGF